MLLWEKNSLCVSSGGEDCINLDEVAASREV